MHTTVCILIIPIEINEHTAFELLMHTSQCQCIWASSSWSPIDELSCKWIVSYLGINNAACRCPVIGPNIYHLSHYWNQVPVAEFEPVRPSGDQNKLRRAVLRMQRFPATKCRGDLETEPCDCVNIHDASWNITRIWMLFQLQTDKLIKNRLWLTSVLEMTIPQCSAM